MKSGVTIQRHPPERGQRRPEAAPAGGCCCCCCCLHSLGGLIGAAVASPVHEQPPAIPTASTDARRTRLSCSAAKLYWVLLLCATVIVAVLYQLADEDDLVWLIIAMVLPFVQLAVSLVAGIALLLSSRPDKYKRLRHLGKITAYAFLGAIIGTIVMILFLAVG